jgi:glycosyltransferase involved in cell wall biosynthesis
MKILHINDTFKQVGGTETYLYSLINIFKAKGHKIFLFAIDEEKEIEEYDLFVYQDIFKRDPFKYILFYYLNPSLYNRLRRWIKKVNPDMIHIHNNGKFTSSILIALQGFNIPVVQTIHDHSIICPTSFCTKVNGEQCDGCFELKCPISGCISWARYAYQRVPEYIKKYLLKTTVDTFIAPSKALQCRLKKNGIQNVIYLPNFIEVEKFIYDINKIESGNVLYVGRLSKEKGIDYLIKALPEIIKACPSSMLNIVGDGPMMSQLLKLVSNLDMEKHVTFHGRLLGVALMAAYQKANVVVIPSVCVENVIAQ